MKIRLTKDEFVPFAPERKGFVRINHSAQNCSGESESLRIERKDDNSISAKCFRCGATGFYSPERRYHPVVVRSQADEEAATGVGTGLRLPDDARSAFTTFPRLVQHWLGEKGGITPVISEGYGILWSDVKQQLYIPVVQETSAFGPKAVGWVIRRFDPKSYLTLTLDRERFYGLLRASERHSTEGEAPTRTEPLVIVEDIISGLRCSEISDTMILCGTELKPDALSLIVKEGYKEAVVFLDSDNPTVLMAARRIAKRLSWMKVRLIETGRDPKTYNKDQLKELIYESCY